MLPPFPMEPRLLELVMKVPEGQSMVGQAWPGEFFTVQVGGRLV